MYDPYLVLSPPFLALSPDVLERELETIGLTTSRNGNSIKNKADVIVGMVMMRSGACGSIRLVDGLESQRETSGTAAGEGELQERWAALLRRFSPVGVIAVSGGVGGLEGGGDAEGERAARRACSQAKVNRGKGGGARVFRWLINYDYEYGMHRRYHYEYPVPRSPSPASPRGFIND